MTGEEGGDLGDGFECGGHLESWLFVQIVLVGRGFCFSGGGERATRLDTGDGLVKLWRYYNKCR